jgi:hypothetical protein
LTLLPQSSGDDAIAKFATRREDFVLTPVFFIYNFPEDFLDV